MLTAYCACGESASDASASQRTRTTTVLIVALAATHALTPYVSTMYRHISDEGMYIYR